MGTVRKQTFMWDSLYSARVQNLEGNKHVAPPGLDETEIESLAPAYFNVVNPLSQGLAKCGAQTSGMQNYPLGFVKKILGLLFIVIYLLLKFCTSKIWKTIHQSKEKSIKIPLYLLQLQQLLTCGQVGFISAST